MTLRDFLLARIAEDEARIGNVRHSAPLITHQSLPRALAECDAKRQRLELLDEMDALPHNIVSSYAYDLLCREALPYADHPDYREEWRPRPSRRTRAR